MHERLLRGRSTRIKSHLSHTVTDTYRNAHVFSALLHTVEMRLCTTFANKNILAKTFLQ